MTGATGAVYGKRLLEELRRVGGIETHVVISKAGALSAAAELDVARRGASGCMVFSVDDGSIR